ncbi:hypothetical protein DIC66_20655 [Rhodoferax lacus]|uniref:Uncharacterized protein n=1 Tax=Rhodoferax lacus TaxID=2184758 RepID=A0A3E1R6I2_9BURK|nr:EthD domain-containing protein [Rhodoferax lacus]RFO94979.1 hypothetical protein DIC66_20655 [Rhodoferax lacus]
MHWKMIYLARRNPALAPEDFAQAWREHSALGRQCRNVQDKVLSVTQCARLLDAVPAGCSTDFDGVNLLGLRDRQAANDIWSDAETLAIMRPDEPRVFDRYVRDFTLVASEQVLRAAPLKGPHEGPNAGAHAGLHGGLHEGPRGDAVLVAFVRRQAAVSPADFQQALAQSASAWADARCVVLNTVEAARPPGYDFDAIVEWWFASADALRLALQTQPLRAGAAADLQAGAAAPLQTGAAAYLHAVCAMQDTVFMATGVSHRRP